MSTNFLSLQRFMTPFQATCNVRCIGEDVSFGGLIMFGPLGRLHSLRIYSVVYHTLGAQVW